MTAKTDTTDIETKIFSLIKRKKVQFPTAEQIREELGLEAKDCSLALRRLRDAGKVVGEGATRAMTYRVA